MSGWITDELLDSLRRVESGGNRFAVSKAGAKGPYQFMDATAKELGLSDPFDEAQSRGAAKKYLTKLDSMFGNPRDALTAYNWGMGNVSNMLRTGKANMPTEARQYAGKVLGNKMDYFDQPDIDPRIAAAMLRKQPGAPMPGMQPPGLVDPSQLLANFSTAPDPLQQQQYAFQQQPQQGRDIAGLRQRADDAYSEGMKRLDAEPDIAQWQEYAKKRSGEGAQHLMLAMAAQQAGKEFEPVSGMYLKQAMAARDPMQVGKAGMITGEGEFIADPFYQREKQADMLLKRSEYYAKLAETAQTQQERAQAAELARQDRLQLNEIMTGQRQQGLDIRRQEIDQRAANQGPKPQAVQDKDGNWVYIQQGQQPIPAGVQGPVPGRAPKEPSEKLRGELSEADSNMQMLATSIDSMRKADSKGTGWLSGYMQERLPGGEAIAAGRRAPGMNEAIQQLTYVTDGIRHGRFGSALTNTEKASAAQYLPSPFDSKERMIEKAEGLRKLMQVNSDRLRNDVNAVGTDRQQLPAAQGQQMPAGDVRSRSQRYFD